MRRALVGYVPNDILKRRTKSMPWRMPLLVIENSWQELKEIFSSSLSSQFGFIDNASFMEHLSFARHGQELHTGAILKTIALECWLRDLLARRLLSAPINLSTVSNAREPTFAT